MVRSERIRTGRSSTGAGQGAVAAAAARAACGRASAIRENAASSSAADTNQVSNALGGAYTPRSSNAWKNGGKRQVWAALACVVVRDRVLGEEHAEHGAGVLDVVRDALGGQRLAEKAAERRGIAVERGVDLGVGGAQAREPGSDGHGVTGQGAGLVDRHRRGRGAP